MTGLDSTTAAGRLRRWALTALEQHQLDDTLPTDPRHLFYEAVMAEVVAKGDPAARRRKGRRPDQNLTEALTWLRERGYVPWEWIEDRTRHLGDRRGYGDTITDGIAAVLGSIRVDVWGDVQPIVVVESESGAGVLTRTARRYRVLVVPVRGQSAGWLRTAVPQAIGDRPVAVCYLGDADKAGHDIEKNTRRVLTEVLAVKDWQRVALTWEQVAEHNLPILERLDHRNGVTYEVCEMEAMPQRLLLDAVEAYFEQWLDVDLDDVLVRERVERAAVAGLLGIEWGDDEG